MKIVGISLTLASGTLPDAFPDKFPDAYLIEIVEISLALASGIYSGKVCVTNMDAAECLFSTFVVKTASIIYLGCMRSHSDENHGDR